MATTVLVEFETFVEDLIPRAAEKPQFSPQQSEDAQHKMSKLFNNGCDKDSKPEKPKEIDIAKTIVGIINELELPKGYKAGLACHPKKARAVAALYPGDKVPSNSKPDWTHSRLFIEFKGESKYDPWDDSDEMSPGESEGETAVDVRAQSIAYAHHTFLHQHRTALYSLFIIGREFRAVRWDRSGVIVSRKADYVKHTDSLLEILWCIAQLDDAQQGLDPTATLIVEDTQAFRMMDHLARPDPSVDADYMDIDNAETVPVPATEVPGVPLLPSGAPPEGDDPDLAIIEECGDDPRVFKYVREKFRESLEHNWPRYKLRVGEEERVFLVGKPIFFASSMFGRATRGYVAVDAKTRRFVFLKDSWRPFYQDVDPEGTYLKMFSNDPSMIVPAYLCDGDVGGQTAYAAIYEGDPGRKIRETRRHQDAACARVAASAEGTRHKKRSREAGETDESPQDVPSPADLAPSDTENTLCHHIHYRIAVKDVCLPLDHFRSTQELIRLIYYCIATHFWAYTTYNLLHRDISSGNLLILPRHVTVDGEEIVEWRGVLTDWELAKAVPKNGTDDKARKPEQTGTWQFMSVASVASHWTLPVAVADELESFFHVMLLYSVRYLPHTLPNVPDFVIEYFDTFQQDAAGRRLCSTLKEAAVQDKRLVYAGKDLLFVKTTGEPGNPINALIKDLLELFHARYQVKKHDEVLKENLGARDATHPSSAPRCKALKKTNMAEPWMVNCDPDPTIDDPEEDWSLLEPLSPETVKLAAQLNTHIRVLQLFGLMETINDDLWDYTGVLSKDQLVNYEPRPRFGMAIETGTANHTMDTTSTGSRVSKRVKTKRSVSAFDAVVLADIFWGFATAPP